MTKYRFKDGRTIAQYCREVKDAPPFRAIVYRVGTLNMTPEEAVSYPKTEPAKNVHGKSFRQFCIDNGLSYSYHNKVYRKLFRELTPEEYIDRYMNKTLYPTTPYQYCKDRGYNYRSLYSMWYSYHMVNMSFQQYIEKYEKHLVETPRISGMKLCKENGLEYAKIYGRYRRNHRGCKNFATYILEVELNGKNS